MAQGQGMSAARNFQIVVYADKISVERYLAHPGTVMVAHNQEFLTLKLLTRTIRKAGFIQPSIWHIFNL